MTETTVMAWLTLFPASEAEIEVTNGFPTSKNPYKNYKKNKMKTFFWVGIEPSGTNHAHRCLTLQIGRDVVFWRRHVRRLICAVF